MQIRPTLPEQTAPRKKNSWWRQPKINRAVRRLPYVISEGDVWFGRKAPGGRAWVWLEASEEANERSTTSAPIFQIAAPTNPAKQLNTRSTMSTRCKPGDLAIIMYDVPQCTSNIGRLVEVRGPSAFNRRKQLTWLIQPVTPEPYLVNNRFNNSVRFMEYREGNIEHPDEWMLPIGAESADEAVEQREDTPEEIEQ